jgi:hypothetical protein
MSCPIQFRIIVNEDDRTLQFRHAFAVDASGAFCPGAWTDWEEVEEMDFLASYLADEEERKAKAAN